MRISIGSASRTASSPHAPTNGLRGATSTKVELLALLGDDQAVCVVPEFVGRPHSVSASARRKIRSDLGVGTDELLVLGVGIGTRRKGIDLFAELGAAAVRAGRSWRFVWIGGERDELFLPVLVEGLGLPLDLLPGVDDLDPYFAAADVLAHTARTDAFPLVALHAALADTAVVSFTGGGGMEEMMAEAFLGGPYPDLSALVDQIDLLVEPGTRSRAAGAQRRHVISLYLDEVAAPILLSQLEQIATARGER